MLSKANWITADQAKAFWRDFYGTVFHEKPDSHCTKGIMSTALIADHMRIDPELAEAFLYKAMEINLTERQGGCWVV